VESVVSCQDVSTIYELPLALHAEGLDQQVAQLLNIWSTEPVLTDWEEIVRSIKEPVGSVRIGIVGKYVELSESYKSLNEALTHGGFPTHKKVELVYVDSESIRTLEDAEKALLSVDGVLVPGGFGRRGTEGKILAIQYARENKVPFLGICLGMQLAVVEFARNVVGLEGANSTEFDESTEHPVIDLMLQQRALADKGGTMRLGAYPCSLSKGSLAAEVYGVDSISERHRHRFEVNNAYREQLEKRGMKLSGLSPDGNLVEMVEIPTHEWFLACQFHPEYQSRPLAPHPVFTRFIEAASAAVAASDEEVSAA
jgi:CTP synthase